MPKGASALRALDGGRGFTLLEMLMSLALTLVIVTVLFSSLVSFKKLQFDQGQRSDVRQTLRAGYEFLARDLDNAGFGLVNTWHLGFFGTLFPNADASDTNVADAITIWSSANTARASLVSSMLTVADPLLIDDSSGFVTGQVVWIMGTCTDDIIRRQKFTVVTATPGPPAQITSGVPFVCRFRNGSSVLELSEITYALAAAGDGRFDLRRAVNGSPPVTVVTGLKDIEFSYLDGATTPAPIVPSDAASRRKIRRVHVELTGRSEEALRATREHSEVDFSGEIAPRNLVLLDLQ